MSTNQFAAMLALAMSLEPPYERQLTPPDTFKPKGHRARIESYKRQRAADRQRRKLLQERSP